MKYFKRIITVIMVVVMITLSACGILPFEGKALESGKVGVEYTASIATGTEDMYYDLDYDSNLPQGLILYDDGTIRGIPEEAGEFTFKAVMIDLDDNEYYADFSLSIAKGSLTYNGSVLPNGKTGDPYLQNLATATGMQTITYAVKEGTPLPAGLVLSEAGELSGFPTEAAENVSFTVVASAEGCDPVEAEFSMKIEQGVIIDDTAGQITFENFTLPDGLVGEEYYQSVRLATGVPNITYSFRFPTGNGLPKGLKANKELGIISGTPTASTYGSITFNVTASAEGYESVTAKCTLRIYDHYVETNKFEAEYIYVDKLVGAGYSSSALGKQLIQGCPAMSNGNILGYLNNPIELKFEINAEEATQAKLIIALGSEIGNFTYDKSRFQIFVNGNEVDYGTLDVKMNGDSLANYTAERFEIEPTINLLKGENVITFKINQADTSDLGGTFTAYGCLFDYIELLNATCKLGWRPRVSNLS